MDDQVKQLWKSDLTHVNQNDANTSTNILNKKNQSPTSNEISMATSDQTHAPNDNQSIATSHRHFTSVNSTTNSTDNSTSTSTVTQSPTHVPTVMFPATPLVSSIHAPLQSTPNSSHCNRLVRSRTITNLPSHTPTYTPTHAATIAEPNHVASKFKRLRLEWKMLLCTLFVLFLVVSVFLAVKRAVGFNADSNMNVVTNFGSSNSSDINISPILDASHQLQDDID